MLALRAEEIIPEENCFDVSSKAFWLKNTSPTALTFLSVLYLPSLYSWYMKWWASLSIIGVFFVTVPSAEATLLLSGTLSEDTTLTAADSPYLVGSLYVPEDLTLTIEAGTVLKFNRRGGLTVYGSLVVEGNEENLVYFTEFRDDLLEDSNGDGTDSLPSPGYWRQVLIMPGATATIEHAVFRYGGYGTGGLSRCFPGRTWCRGTLMNAGSLTADNIFITDSFQNSLHLLGGEAYVRAAQIIGTERDFPIFAEAGSSTITQSSITSTARYRDTDIPLGVNVYDATVDLANNWWGDTSGPNHLATNATGTGSHVAGTDAFTPWLTSDLFATITEPDPEPDPNAVSNVLFLPGIQASRLYRDGLFGEDQLWEPNFIFDNSDTRKLAMDEDGNSLESVYTRDVLSYIADDTSKPVYGGLLEEFASLQSVGIINAYEVYAYDWRYDVTDIVANGTRYETDVVKLEKIVVTLAAQSKTGKVSLVAHSNGGLLAKALIDHLEAIGQSGLIDQLIMIGTPQLGTPKAIGSLLHGTDQGIRVLNNLLPIVTDETARYVSQNMPGAYGLLPGQAYFDQVSDPVITFESGQATQVLIDFYGAQITSEQALDNFLSDTANTRSQAVSLNDALILNQNILDASRNTRTQLDTWVPPADVTVSTIIGVGRNTISGFRYEPITEFVCVTASLCDEQFTYKPIPQISSAGDQTVMAVSAQGLESMPGNRYYVDFEKIEQTTAQNFFHYNMTESTSVKQLVRNVLQATSTVDEFVTQTNTTVAATDQILLGGHSPVYLYIEDGLGRRTGQIASTTWLQEIPNTEFLSVGGSSYVIAPQNLDFTIHLHGYDYGGVTFTAHQLAGTEQPLLSKVPVSYITGSSTVTLTYETERFSDVYVDEDGNGTPEYRMTQAGVRIPAEISDTSYSDIFTYLETSVDAVTAEKLTGLLRLAEQFHLKISTPQFITIERRLLTKLATLVSLYEARSILDGDIAQVLIDMIYDLSS